MMYFITWLIFILVTIHHEVTADTELPSIESLNEDPTLHFRIRRRGGSYESFTNETQVANLEAILDELHDIAERYGHTYRKIVSNRIYRAPKVGVPEYLITQVQKNGTWFATINIGTPPQRLELDLDMLTSDFYVSTTQSHDGTKYEDLFSSSIVKSTDDPFNECEAPSESFLLPTCPSPVNLKFALCRPRKRIGSCIEPSGSMLGLAAKESIVQIKSPSLIKQLVEEGVIKKAMFSIMLINSHEGVLSLGGTAAKASEAVDASTKAALDGLAMGAMLQEDHQEKGFSKREDIPAGSAESMENMFRWSETQGAKGWWQILMSGVWVGRRKVLKNQPVVVDLNTPLTIAPPSAAAQLYRSIPGAWSLEDEYPGIYAFPCLNPPFLSFEFARWNFPALRGGKGTDSDGRDAWGRPGGRLSMGRYKEGSGFCIGSIIGLDVSNTKPESTNNAGSEGKWIPPSKSRAPSFDGNGMQGVWIVGEPWLRGVNAVFDMENQRVGFRST